MLVKFNEDTMVIPRESQVFILNQFRKTAYNMIFVWKWFGFYKEGQSNDLYQLEESILYLNVKYSLSLLIKNRKILIMI